MTAGVVKVLRMASVLAFREERITESTVHLGLITSVVKGRENLESGTAVKTEKVIHRYK